MNFRHPFMPHRCDSNLLRIWLIFSRDRASAVVRWTAGNRLGAEFSEPISLDGLNSN